VTDGNASGATTGISFVRQIGEMEPGETIAVISFGAGGSGDVFFIEVGGK
jgi:3-hydroxy-3-methylglutaryl CoA synthase